MKHLPQELHEFEYKSFATPKLKQQIAIRLESAVEQTKECVCDGADQGVTMLIYVATNLSFSL